MQHFVSIGISGAWSAIAIPAMLIGLVRSHFDPVMIGVSAIFSGFILIIRNTLWVAKRVYIGDGYIVFGRASRRRRIAFSDIVRVERPWWTKPDRSFVPVEVFLREGKPLKFFPAAGAEDLLRHRTESASNP